MKQGRLIGSSKFLHCEKTMLHYLKMQGTVTIFVFTFNLQSVWITC